MSERNMRGKSWLDASQVGGYSLEDPDEMLIAEAGFRLAFDSENRFIHGGGWRYSAQRARVALRDYDSPVNRHAYLGFRLVRAGGLDE